MAVATSKAIKQIIVREYKEDNPAFAVIDLLQKALKQAMALENLLSVDDVAPGLPTTRAQLMDTAGGNHRVYVTTGTGTTTATGASPSGTPTPSR